jgi:hypothetical protein
MGGEGGQIPKHDLETGDQTLDQAETWNSRYSLLFENQNEIGKWLLATLVLVNGGAIIGLLNGKNVSYQEMYYAAPWFGFGIGSAIAAGIATWANVMGLAKAYERLLDQPRSVASDEPRSPGRRTGRQSIGYAAAASLIFGLLSLAFFARGSAAAWLFLAPAPTIPQTPQFAVIIRIAPSSNLQEATSHVTHRGAARIAARHKRLHAE